ncbi:MAG: ABC transporter permease subunit [Microbacterium sp.]
MSASVQRILLGVAGFAVLLGGWQLASTGEATQRALPGVGETAAHAVALLGAGQTWVQIGETLWIAVLGLLLGIAGGVVVGVVIGLSTTAMHATRFALDFLRPIPAIVILPLVMLLLGPTTQMAVFLSFFAVILPAIAQVAAGVDDVDPVAAATARSFGMSRAEVIWRVVLPSTSAHIGTAVRVSAPISLMIVTIAGLLGGAPGLGRQLALAQTTGRFADLIAYVVILGVLGLLVQIATESLERRLLHWHTSFRAEVV